MDKRWRNLGFFVFVVIVLVILYLFVLPLIITPQRELSIDAGYSSIYDIFSKNDVNIENVQTLSMVSMDENGKVVWIESKNNLLAVRSDLVDFQNNINNYSSQDRQELLAAAKVYADAIDFALMEEGRFNKISPSLKGIIDCNNKTFLSDLNTIASQEYYGVYLLAQEVDDFAYKYDPYSELIQINLDDQYTNLLLLTSLVSEISSNCGGGVV